MVVGFYRTLFDKSDFKFQKSLRGAKQSNFKAQYLDCALALADIYENVVFAEAKSDDSF